MFHYMDHKEAFEMLRKAGFRDTEIDRITKFRKQLSPNELDQASDNHRRLEFFRWLFQTGKLTEFVS
ncbi:hypothetical protein KDW_29480 [Dictyobacter vulcani]|uniref:Uncharacterized protein n=1 Tax=Dictyobacter vulcani TaxID=2607529 RepID=A0A5J4KUA1_9CHLR|nr:hypothetical protein [Dictyobacter vulcani]GER88786.1 hypothetical protein KDW_29480 [Dictyobacter vulcani]